eukprot:403342966
MVRFDLEIKTPSVFLAQKLQVNITLYDFAILHTTITEKSEQEVNLKSHNYQSKTFNQNSLYERFRISEHAGVEWDQLTKTNEIRLEKFESKALFEIQDKQDIVQYEIIYDPFRIIMKINKVEVMKVNSKDILYFENRNIQVDALKNDISKLFFENLRQSYDYSIYDDGLSELINMVSFYQKYRLFSDKKVTLEPNFDFRESIGLSFETHSQYLYGLPERADQNLLRDTDNSEPYRLYNVDIFNHDPYSKQNLYGSLPYVTSHSEQFDTSIVWMNSAETFVDIIQSNTEARKQKVDKFYQQRQVNFLSESGVMEFFIFGSSVQNGGPQYIMQKLAILTGFQSLPPYFSIGFHYSKWEKISTDSLINKIDLFEQYQMPVDVLWLDIEHADEKRYFTFDMNNFQDINRLDEKVQQTEKKLTVITDPHIMHDRNYHVYRNGMKVIMAYDFTGIIEKGAFVRDNKGKNIFVGTCWPGESTTSNFNIWIDMNEPSVFSGDELTLPKNAYHLTENHDYILHRDVHNAYGILMAKNSYQGIIEREEDQNLRPFMLTRSVFFGSQKYGAMWTGDNQARPEFVGLSISMCLTLGLSGIPFCGADIGGFTGFIGPEYLARWYLFGVFQPFMRAHGHESVNRREPWAQMRYSEDIKSYLLLRYQIIPYIYTAFYQSTQSGLPIMRPLWMMFPKERGFYKDSIQYMFGDSFLISPNYPNPDQVQLLLPFECNWYNYDDFSIMPKSKERTKFRSFGIFIREGSILTKKYLRKTSTAKHLRDPFLLEVYPIVSNNTAKGQLYLDDGKTYNYERQQQYTLVEFVYQNDELHINQLYHGFDRNPVENKQTTQDKGNEQDNGFVIGYVKICNYMRKVSHVLVVDKSNNKLLNQAEFNLKEAEKILTIKLPVFDHLTHVNGLFLKIYHQDDKNHNSKNQIEDL